MFEDTGRTKIEGSLLCSKGLCGRCDQGSDVLPSNWLIYKNKCGPGYIGGIRDGVGARPMQNEKLHSLKWRRHLY